MTMYYIAKDGQQSGPFSEPDVRQRIQFGQLAASDLCWREGMADWQPISSVFAVPLAQPPPSQGQGLAAGSEEGTPFLFIPVSRLIAMSILSFGLYDAYWIYRNWRYVKERDRLNIKPFWRGVYAIFYCHSLLRRIHADKHLRAVQMPSFSPAGLATGWVILAILSNIIGRAPGMAASVVAACIPTFLCLAPVQKYINGVCLRRNPNQAYYAWSSGHIFCLVWGISLWTLLLVVYKPFD